MNDEDSKTRLKLEAQKISLRIDSFERLMETKYTDLTRRVSNLEKMFWTQILMVVSGFGAILYHLLTN